MLHNIEPETSSLRTSNHQSLRVKKSNNPKREEFNNLMENVKHSASFESRFSTFSEIIASLRTKLQIIYDTDSLSQAFESLLMKAESVKCVEKLNWTEMETNFLVSIVAYYCLYSSEDFRSLTDNHWQHIEALFPTRQTCQIVKQWKSLLKVNLRQCPWTPEEDRELVKLVAEFGTKRNWKIIAEKLSASQGFSVMREMRQCRERWIKHLNPKLHKGNWTTEEDLKLMKAFVSKGKKWLEIAKVLGNRTDTAVKSRWNSLINENKSSSRLDENLSQSDEESYKIVANRIIENISQTCTKKEKRTKKRSLISAVPLSDSKRAESANSSNNLNFFSGNQSYSLRALNTIPSQNTDEMKPVSGSNIFFAFVYMKSKKINFINRVSGGFLATFA